MNRNAPAKATQYSKRKIFEQNTLAYQISTGWNESTAEIMARTRRPSQFGQ